MTKPSKQQIAAVKSALREIHAEILGWDPHILVLFKDETQKAQIKARMSQLGWHHVDDPSNETDDISMAEFSLDAPTHSTTRPPTLRNKARRIKYPASFFAAIGTIFAIVGLIVVGAGFYTNYRMQSLNRSGTQVAGTVAYTYFESNRGLRTYYVSYRFVDAHGALHQSNDAYPFDGWNSLHHGDPIGVTYLADDPDRNNLTQRIKLVSSRSSTDDVILAVWPWIISGCFFLVYFVRRKRS